MSSKPEAILGPFTKCSILQQWPSFYKLRQSKNVCKALLSASDRFKISSAEGLRPCQLWNAFLFSRNLTSEIRARHSIQHVAAKPKALCKICEAQQSFDTCKHCERCEWRAFAQIQNSCQAPKALDVILDSRSIFLTKRIRNTQWRGPTKRPTKGPTGPKGQSLHDLFLACLRGNQAKPRTLNPSGSSGRAGGCLALQRAPMARTLGSSSN